MSPNTLHQIGKRDAVAEILMLVRDKGERAALREIAGQLLAVNPEHCHAAWYLANHPPLPAGS